MNVQDLFNKAMKLSKKDRKQNERQTDRKICIKLDEIPIAVDMRQITFCVDLVSKLQLVVNSFDL